MMLKIVNAISGVINKYWREDFCGSITFNFFKGGITTMEIKITDKP